MPGHDTLSSMVTSDFNLLLDISLLFLIIILFTFSRYYFYSQERSHKTVIKNNGRYYLSLVLTKNVAHVGEFVRMCIE